MFHFTRIRLFIRLRRLENIVLTRISRIYTDSTFCSPAAIEEHCFDTDFTDLHGFNFLLACGD